MNIIVYVFVMEIYYTNCINALMQFIYDIQRLTPPKKRNGLFDSTNNIGRFCEAPPSSPHIYRAYVPIRPDLSENDGRLHVDRVALG